MLYHVKKDKNFQILKKRIMFKTVMCDKKLEL